MATTTTTITTTTFQQIRPGSHRSETTRRRRRDTYAIIVRTAEEGKLRPPLRYPLPARYPLAALDEHTRLFIRDLDKIIPVE